jgi:haloacetate dehalogenase
VADGEGLPGFEYTRVAAGASDYRVGVAGEGPPVLLLHGFPQNHRCWRLVASELTARNTVVVTDLKVYGDTRSPPGGPLGEGYSKREMAIELVAVLSTLGMPRFAVAGHDRGARVAYRMALDEPQRVERLCVLNIVPTVDQFERMAAAAALEYWPWFLLAQPPPFAERLVAANAELFLRHVHEAWAAVPGAVDPAPHLSTFTPGTIAAMCADYRAAFHIDRPMDAEDRSAGRRIGCPVLVHWGAAEDALSTGPLDAWRRWAHDVRGGPLPSGHFIPEEAPTELVASLRGFLAAPAPGVTMTAEKVGRTATRNPPDPGQDAQA